MHIKDVVDAEIFQYEWFWREICSLLVAAQIQDLFFLLIGKEKNEVGSSASVCGTVVKLYIQFLVLDLIRR